MRILVVEDEAIIALCIGMTLEKAGHEVMGPVNSLNGCLDLLQVGVPDLALIDINLEFGKNGVDVARELQKKAIMSLFVSAVELESAGDKAAALGCLHKPFAAQSLIESVEIASGIKRGRQPNRMPEGLELF